MSIATIDLFMLLSMGVGLLSSAVTAQQCHSGVADWYAFNLSCNRAVDGFALLTRIVLVGLAVMLHCYLVYVFAEISAHTCSVYGAWVGSRALIDSLALVMVYSVSPLLVLWAVLCILISPRTRSVDSCR